MSRKIIDNLFSDQKVFMPKDQQFVSMKEWKCLVSRLDRIQVQVESNQEKMDLICSKLIKWFNATREKIYSLSKSQEEMDLEVKDMFKKWEEKLLNLVQPEQRKEDQKRIMSLMGHHTQFIQSYSKEIDALKTAFSKNEYQVYQLLEQMRSIRIEMGLIGAPPSANKKAGEFNKLKSKPPKDRYEPALKEDFDWESLDP